MTRPIHDTPENRTAVYNLCVYGESFTAAGIALGMNRKTVRNLYLKKLAELQYHNHDWDFTLDNLQINDRFA